jgi:hypothetical protein
MLGKQRIFRGITLATFLMAALDGVALEWTPREPLNTDASTDARFDSSFPSSLRGGPTVATDRAGHWVTVWEAAPYSNGIAGDFDLYVSRSTDNGATWSPPERLHANGAEDTGDDTAPCLATDGTGTWVCVWASTERFGDSLKAGSNVLFAVSTDNGESWSAPAPLNDNAMPGGDAPAVTDHQPELKFDFQGGWICVWQRSSATVLADIYSATSGDGTAWSEATVVNSNSDHQALDAAPVVAADGLGGWVCAWESFDDTVLPENNGERWDIFVSHSSGSGTDWSELEILNSNSTEDGTDDTYLSLESDGQGTLIVAWLSTTSEGVTTLLHSRSENGGAAWTPAASLSDSPTYTYTSHLNPFVRFDGTSQWVVMWEGYTTGQPASYSLHFIESTNAGIAWTEPRPIDPDPVFTSAGRNPALASDGEGNWVATWNSFEDWNGETGSDGEVFVARTRLGGPDINGDGTVDAADVQLVVNGVLQIPTSGFDPDVNGDELVDAIDVQLVVNAVLGIA